MAVWATAQDVLDAWIGEDAPTDEAKVETWAGKAERLIRRTVPDVVSRVEVGETDLAENLNDVVVAMVTRVFRNPQGVRQVNTTTGPFTENVTFGGDTPGSLVLLADELVLLSPEGESAKASPTTVDMIPPTSPFHPDWTPVYGVIP